MSEFSITDVAFTGFRIVRERPRVVAVWIAAQIAVALGLNLLMVVCGGPALAQLSALGMPTDQTMARFEALAPQLVPFAVAAYAFLLLFQAVANAAMNRAVLRPAEDRFGYLALGRAELNQLGLLLILCAGALIAALVGLTIASGLASLVVVAAGGSMAAGQALLLALTIFGGLGGWVYFGVRLSLAAPLTFATGRIDLAGAWRLSRGHFAQIFWSYALALTLTLCVLFLSGPLLEAMVAVAGGGPQAVDRVMRPDMASLASALSPLRLFYLALSGVFSALAWPISATPPAAIYKALGEGA